ncbi:MAG: cupredoxin domain-containing protein [Halobacteriaceae archaeon]
MPGEQQVTRRSLLRYGGVAGMTILAGCGGGNGGKSTPQSVAQQKYPNYNWSQLKEVEPTSTTEIEMTSGLKFKPMIAKMSKGATVTWINTSSFAHTVVIPQLNVDKRASGGENITTTVNQTGTFDYVCDIHPPSMLGRLIVKE